VIVLLFHDRPLLDDDLLLHERHDDLVVGKLRRGAAGTRRTPVDAHFEVCR
jgi:hypothetical protein